MGPQQYRLIFIVIKCSQGYSIWNGKVYIKSTRELVRVSIWFAVIGSKNTRIVKWPMYMYMGVCVTRRIGFPCWPFIGFSSRFVSYMYAGHWVLCESILAFWLAHLRPIANRSVYMGNITRLNTPILNILFNRFCLYQYQAISSVVIRCLFDDFDFALNWNGAYKIKLNDAVYFQRPLNARKSDMLLERNIK